MGAAKVCRLLSGAQIKEMNPVFRWIGDFVQCFSNMPEFGRGKPAFKERFLAAYLVAQKEFVNPS